MVKGTNTGGRTKEANEISIVYVHKHGGHDVTCKPHNMKHRMAPSYQCDLFNLSKKNYSLRNSDFDLPSLKQLGLENNSIG